MADTTIKQRIPRDRVKVEAIIQTANHFCVSKEWVRTIVRGDKFDEEISRFYNTKYTELKPIMS